MTFKSETIKKIKLMKSEGLSNKSVAKLLNTTESAIQKCIEDGYKSWEVNQATEKKILELYRQGKTVAEIKNIVGYSHQAIIRRLEAVGWKPKKYTRLKKEEKEEICKLYEGGTSAQKLADRYHVNVATVFRTIQKNEK